HSTRASRRRGREVVTGIALDAQQPPGHALPGVVAGGALDQECTAAHPRRGPWTDRTAHDETAARHRRPDAGARRHIPFDFNRLASVAGDLAEIAPRAARPS